MTSLQAESPGTQACTNAVNAIRDIIGDLDTTIELVKKGTLHPNNENETFLDHSDTIRKTIKALAEDTKCFTTGVMLSQEQLDVAAQNSATTIIQLAEVVKKGVASLGTSNIEEQVLLINVLKDKAAAVGRLILAAKAAIGKSIDDQMIDSAEVMIRDVISLLETLKSIEDQHSRGACDPKSTIEATGHECCFENSFTYPLIPRSKRFPLRSASDVTSQKKENPVLAPSGYAFEGMTGGVAQELSYSREQTIRNESKFKFANEKLKALRKAKYENRSPDEYKDNDSP